MTLLFFTRLFLYFLAITLPLLHPAIVVSYDIPSILLWFLLVPIEVILAYWANPARLPARYLPYVGLLPLLVIPFVASGWSLQTLFMLLVGGSAFLLTRLIFFHPSWGRRVAFLEPFALVLVYLRLINFFRSSEEVLSPEKTTAIGISPQVLLALALGAFLIHGVVLYYTLYQEKSKKRILEGIALTMGTLLLTLLFMILPSDFVQHTVVTNWLQNEVNPPPVPIDEEGEGFPNGSLRPRREFPEGRFRIPGQREGGGKRNRLEGIPQDQWPGTEGRGGQGEGGKQYAVMIVASQLSPLYMANQYRGELHPVEGFLPDRGEPLNELAFMRLLETWKNREPPWDLGREEVSFFALSTLAERYLPYLPHTIEPTIFQRQFRPFLFQYRGTSLVSRSSLKDWQEVPELSKEEKEQLAPYLEVPLVREDLSVFQTYLKSILKGNEGYFERILTILKSFSTFQYALGFSEDTSIPTLLDFLTFSREGDCTEFSNTAALLARMAGIPSRVVTGYLASEDLQTPAHIRGLAHLRRVLPPLQAFPLEELFLVTNAHRHSWAQFWLPGYGWIDFETTSFAIPPVGMGDISNWDVVIPLIEETPFVPIPSFPWKMVLRLLTGLIALGILGLYSFRYLQEAWYLYQAKGKGVQAAKALYRLLLLRLAANRFPLKAPSATALEYVTSLKSTSLPSGTAEQLHQFASLYTEIAYNSRLPLERQEGLVSELRALYQSIVEGIPSKGVGSALYRIFSLRGLRYTW